MSAASWCCKSFCVVPCVSFCTGHFVMMPLNMTYLHCLQHSLFEHLFNLYWKEHGPYWFCVYYVNSLLILLTCRIFYHRDVIFYLPIGRGKNIIPLEFEFTWLKVQGSLSVRRPNIFFADVFRLLSY